MLLLLLLLLQLLLLSENRQRLLVLKDLLLHGKELGSVHVVEVEPAHCSHGIHHLQIERIGQSTRGALQTSERIRAHGRDIELIVAVVTSESRRAALRPPRPKLSFCPQPDCTPMLGETPGLDWSYMLEP